MTETASTRAWMSSTALRTVSSEARTLPAVCAAFSRASPAAVAMRRLLSFTSPALATSPVKERACCATLAETSSMLRSEEHTSELQSLMRISYAVFCLKKKKKTYYSRKNKRYTDYTNDGSGSMID